MSLQRPKSKGNRFEKEVVDLYRAAGWKDARRNFQSGGQGGSDISGGPSDTLTECKNVEKLNIWQALAQCEADCRATDQPIVAFTRNREPNWAAVRLDFLIELLVGAEPNAIEVTRFEDEKPRFLPGRLDTGPGR